MYKKYIIIWKYSIFFEYLIIKYSQIFFLCLNFIDIRIKLWYINNRVNSRGDRMKFRKMIFVLTITFSVIFVSMLGTSYAYYVSTAGTTINVTTPDIDTGVAVVFEHSQYINTSVGIPINEEDIDDYASTSEFTITPNTDILSDAEVLVNIGIMDLYIDSELVINDFKYDFKCNDGTSDVITKNGTGEDFTDVVMEANYLKLGTLDTINNTFNVNNVYTCTFRVWLQNNPTASQNGLMNRKFRGLFRVNTLFKK